MTCPDCGGTGRVNRSRRAIEVAERYADGAATEDEMRRAFSDALAAHPSGDPNTNPAATMATMVAITYSLEFVGADFLAYGVSCGVPPAAQALLLRCVAGNPFRPVRLPSTTIGRTILGWPGDLAVLALARAIYTDLDWAALGVLADALEEAGCGDAAVLGHLRETCRRCKGKGWIARRISDDGVGRSTATESCPDCGGSGHLPAPHCRGCHVLDLILGKE